MKLVTIGFKGKSAAEFFGKLRDAGVERVLDVRRSNSSHLAGFTKGRDLAFFLGLFNIGYEHVPDLAPSEGVLREYRTRLGHKKKDDDGWEAYSGQYLSELAGRAVVEVFRKAAGEGGTVCLLCSEATAERCHRRLLAEYIAALLPGVTVAHL